MDKSLKRFSTHLIDLMAHLDGAKFPKGYTRRSAAFRTVLLDLSLGYIRGSSVKPRDPLT